ncbi:pseudouridine-5'-phosphate glycosidase, partial [Staphylococcus cohnii]|uniref:pseudouridine-5'-phosphate glycosidase n=1 Tax=Staphylococcus cohnii TaxID=29382 RepID=UPI001642CF68
YPQDLQIPTTLQNIIPEYPAIPPTIPLIHANIKIPFQNHQLQLLPKTHNLPKLSPPDFPQLLPTKHIPPTTLASTIITPQLAQIQFFLTRAI